MSAKLNCANVSPFSLEEVTVFGLIVNRAIIKFFFLQILILRVAIRFDCFNICICLRSDLTYTCKDGKNNNTGRCVSTVMRIKPQLFNCNYHCHA